MKLTSEIITSLVLWLILAALCVWAHFTLPDTPMAIHFGIDGTPNGFAPRDQALFIVPALMLLLLVLMIWVLPATMPKKTPMSRLAVPYGMAILAIAALMTVTHAMLIFHAAGLPVDHMLVMKIAVGMLFVVLGNYLPKTRQNWLMGIRTPWTLSDERVWDKTHRFSGPLFMLAGAVVMIAAFALRDPASLYVMIGAILATALITVIYSYIAARGNGSA